MSNNPNRYLGRSKNEFEQKLDKFPSAEQKKYYNDLRNKCSQIGIRTRRNKPTTKSEYSEEIAYMKALIEERNKTIKAYQNSPTTQEEKLLLFHFRKFPPATRAEIVNYLSGVDELSTEIAIHKKA